MLETKIGELTVSINTLIEVLREQGKAQIKDPCCSSNPQAEAKSKKPKEVKKKEGQPKAQSEDSFEGVKKAILALARQEGGRDKAIAILGEFNAEKASEVSEDDYEGILGKLQEALNG